VEIRDDFLHETVTDITDRIDLPSPLAGSIAITGTGAETYTLPTDFKRLQRHENAVYHAMQDRPCVPVERDGDWAHIKDTGTAGVVKYFRLTGYDENWSISFYTPISASNNVTVSYMTNSWLVHENGSYGNQITSETDVLLLPRRAVEVGTIWRFRERRGLPYVDKYNEYEALLARMSNDHAARRVVSFGDRDKSVRWQDLVPSVIPSS